jgi:hypothetical protein
VTVCSRWPSIACSTCTTLTRTRMVTVPTKALL